MDESSKQQVKEVRTPIPMKEGQPERYDNEYERNGVSHFFMFFAPLERLATCKGNRPKDSYRLYSSVHDKSELTGFLL